MGRPIGSQKSAGKTGVLSRYIVVVRSMFMPEAECCIEYVESSTYWIRAGSRLTMQHYNSKGEINQIKWKTIDTHTQ